jgi:hypothetical protein
MGPADAQTVHAKLEIHAIAGTTAASSSAPSSCRYATATSAITIPGITFTTERCGRAPSRRRGTKGRSWRPWPPGMITSNPSVNSISPNDRRSRWPSSRSRLTGLGRLGHELLSKVRGLSVVQFGPRRRVSADHRGRPLDHAIFCGRPEGHPARPSVGTLGDGRPQAADLVRRHRRRGAAPRVADVGEDVRDLVVLQLCAVGRHARRGRFLVRRHAAGAP